MSQTLQILNYLKQGNSITSWEAIQRFNCTRLSGRIYDIKKLGYLIDEKTDTNPNTKKHFSRYKLITKEIQPELVFR